MQRDTRRSSSIAHHNIAEAFSAATGAHGASREHHHLVVRVIGEHLAQAGIPGEWDALEPKALLRSLANHDGLDLELFCFDAMWLYLYLHRMGLVGLADVTRLIRGIATHGPKTKGLTLMLHDAVGALEAQSEGLEAIPAPGPGSRSPRTRYRKFR